MTETLKLFLSDFDQKKKNHEEVWCHYVCTPDSFELLQTPMLSTQMKCGWCKGKECYTPDFSLDRPGIKLWICANPVCASNKRPSREREYQDTSPKVRALEWPLFCEINGLGDIDHEVTFEKIKQSPGKLDYMFKFSNSPSGIIFMRGDPGTGKTYASLGICEYFTRRERSCMFITQQKVYDTWLDKSNTEQFYHVKLLVVDDFGTGDISSGFMKFFFNLINSRIQWRSKGTVITTNLDIHKFNEVCGEALADRIMTGQQFEFIGETRRKKTIL